MTNVAIVFASLRGFNRYAENLPPEQAVAELNELIGYFDIAAQKHGVEKVKTIGGSYLAACGLTVQRLDHANRAVAFSREMLDIVRRHNEAHEAQLDLCLGINSGTIMAGVIGDAQFAYDIWGSPVNLARHISLAAEANTMLITQAVYARLDSREDFCELTQPMHTAMGEFTLWQWRPSWLSIAPAEQEPPQ